MYMNSVNNAVSSKAKAKYGNRISETMYKEMIHTKSISDLCSYLKEQTYYQGVLEDVNERTIHRKQLETLIRKQGYIDIYNVQKYAQGNKKGLFSIYTMQLEIEQIGNCLRSFQGKGVKEFLVELPLFMNQYFRFDLNELAAVDSYEGLLHVVKGTPYEKVLYVHQPMYGQRVQLPEIESALDSFYYDSVFLMIQKKAKNSVKRQLLSIFQTAIELRNVITIYRYKKYFNASTKEIFSKLYLKHQRINDETWLEYAGTKDAQVFLELLSKSNYRFYQDEDKNVFIEYSSEMIRYSLASRLLHFSSDAAVVLTCFIVCREIEINNIINIIEGIRYGVSEENITKLLIL